MGDQFHRKVLQHCVASISKAIGFEAVEADVLKDLTQILANYMNELCRSTKEVSEHAARTSISLNDVQISMLNMGMDMDALMEFLWEIRVRGNPASAIEVKTQAEPALPPTLKIGEQRPHSSSIPNFLPPFPDPHTYLTTEISGERDSNYERVRELSAVNKRNTESSLKGYALAVYPSTSVFRQYEKGLYAEAEKAIEVKDLQRQRTMRDRIEARYTLNDSARPAMSEEGYGISPVATSSSLSRMNLEHEMELEELFEPKETVKSYVRQRMSSSFQVLLPFEEDRPYLSALMTDEDLNKDTEEEKTDYFARILSKEMEDIGEDDFMDFESYN